MKVEIRNGRRVLTLPYTGYDTALEIELDRIAAEHPLNASKGEQTVATVNIPGGFCFVDDWQAIELAMLFLQAANTMAMENGHREFILKSSRMMETYLTFRISK